MEPHQQRVVDERIELDERAKKLSDFIGLNPVFETIDAEEQERMKEQCEIMWQYSEILGKRIAAFPSEEKRLRKALRAILVSDDLATAKEMARAEIERHVESA